VQLTIGSPLGLHNVERCEGSPLGLHNIERCEDLEFESDDNHSIKYNSRLVGVFKFEWRLVRSKHEDKQIQYVQYIRINHNLWNQNRLT